MSCLVLLLRLVNKGRKFVSRVSSPVPSQDFNCNLPRDQSRDVTHRLGIFVILQCTSFRAYASSFRILLLRLCSNRWAETLAVNMKFSIESPLLGLTRLNS